MVAGLQESVAISTTGSFYIGSTTSSSLIDQETRWWDVDLIQNLFPPGISAAILKVFLPFEPQNNLLFWEKERSGLYSVRSGYRMIKQCERHFEMGESSTAGQERFLWWNIWRMRIPNKVKLFAWRLGLDSLSTHEKLARRRILDDDKCPFFQTKTEDLYHAIFECPNL